MFIVISVVSYVTCVGILMVNPAWEMSSVFTDTPGIVMFFAKKIVLGHLLHTSSYWHWIIG